MIEITHKSGMLSAKQKSLAVLYPLTQNRYINRASSQLCSVVKQSVPLNHHEIHRTLQSAVGVLRRAWISTCYLG